MYAVGCDHAVAACRAAVCKRQVDACIILLKANESLGSMNKFIRHYRRQGIVQVCAMQKKLRGAIFLFIFVPLNALPQKLSGSCVPVFRGFRSECQVTEPS